MPKPPPLSARILSRLGLVTASEAAQLREELRDVRQTRRDYRPGPPKRPDRMAGQVTGSKWARSVAAYVGEAQVYTDVEVRASAVAALSPVACQWLPDPKARGKRPGWAKRDLDLADANARAVSEWMDRPTPDRQTTMEELVKRTVTDVDLAGCGYWLKRYADQPDVTGLGTRDAFEVLDRWYRTAPKPGTWAYAVERVRPSYMRAAVWTADEIGKGATPGSIVDYFALRFGDGTGSQTQELHVHPERVVWFHAAHPDNDLDGLGWVEVVAGTVADDDDVLNRWDRQLQNEGLTDIIETDASLTEAQRTQILTAYEERVSATTRTAAILDNGAKLAPYGGSAADAGYTSRLDRSEVRRTIASRVPPILEGRPDTSHYNNAEQQMDMLANWVALPMARWIWNRVSIGLGPDFGVPGLWWEPETDYNAYIEEGFEEVELSRAAAISAIVDRVAAGQLGRDAGVGQMMGLHGMSDEEADRVLGSAGKAFAPEVDLYPTIARVNAVVPILTQAASGMLDPASVPPLLALLGLEADAAGRLLAGNGSSFVAAPPVGFPMAKALDWSAIAALPGVKVTAPIVVDWTRDDYGLPPGPIGQWWSPEEMAAAVVETPTRQGSQAQLARDVARRSAMVENRIGAEVEKAMAGLLGDQAQRLAMAIAANRGGLRARLHDAPGLATKDLAGDIDRIIREALGDSSTAIRAMLEGLTSEALAEAFGLGGDLVGVSSLSGDLLDAVRSAWFAKLDIRSKAMTDTTAMMARRVMRQGIADGATLGQLANAVEDYMVERIPYRALTIAQTEAGGAVQAGLQTGYKAAGVERKEWSASMDLRVRPSHSVADGQRVDIGAHFEVGHDHLAHPRDMLRGSAKEVINCRCSSVPVI